jgi:hypothetical protein
MWSAGAGRDIIQHVSVDEMDDQPDSSELQASMRLVYIKTIAALPATSSMDRLSAVASYARQTR